MCIFIYEYISEGGVVVSLLAENHGISCIDVNLEDPVTVIVDNVTAICLIDEESISERPTLKNFLKQIAQLVFKFKRIWILIRSSSKTKKVVYQY
jgi:hypothetical protein